VNDLEAKQFIRELIISFPTFESVAKESPNLSDTHRSWAKAWDDLTLSECQAALAKLTKAGGIGWDDYRSPGPFIRSLVMRDRKNTPMSEDELVSHSQQQREAAKRRAEYQKLPMDATMQRAFAVGRAMLDRGEPMYLVHDVTDRIIAGEDVGDLKKAV
jgi:hypothetical protein